MQRLVGREAGAGREGQCTVQCGPLQEEAQQPVGQLASCLTPALPACSLLSSSA